MKKIPLTQGKFTFVDDDVYEWASKFKWYAHKHTCGRYYAARNVLKSNGRRTLEYLHRRIVQAARGEDTHHKDEDSLNNQGSNLQIVTRAQHVRLTPRNKANKMSKFRGVTRNRRDGNWQVRIYVRPKNLHIGYFDSEKEAAQAYDTAARKFFGEFAFLNFS